MSMGHTNPDGWEQLYQLALLETDQAKVSARVAEAHAAISRRLDDLASSPLCDEYAALKVAQRFLCLGKKKELNGRL